MKRILFTLMVSFVGGIMAIGVYSYFQGDTTTTIAEKQQVAFTNLPVDNPPTSGALDFTFAAEISTPAVVHITTSSIEKAPAGNLGPFGDFFGGRGYNIPRQGSGSGVIITNDGYIVTNNHVIDKAQEIKVILNDGREFEGDIVGTDPSTDLALVKIKAEKLPFLRFGDSDRMKIGEWVLAVGNPFNLNSTVTAGIISAKARNINLLGGGSSIESFLQTDAAVNPGNSGGALINLKGELIGINTAIASQTGSFSGYSFAIPVNIAKKVTEDLLEFGVVQRGYIGVMITDVNATLAEQQNLTTLTGVYVNGLSEGGAADKAGIKEGDVIIKVNGIDVKTSPELQEQVGRYRPGDDVSVTVLRKSKEKVFNVTLRNADKTTSLVKNNNSEEFKSLGAEFEELSPSDLNKLNIPQGIKIDKIVDGGKLSKIGIKPGFIITHVDRKPVKSIDDINRNVRMKRGTILIEGFYPNSSTKYTYGIPL